MPKAEEAWVPGLPLAREWHAKASDMYHDNPECPVAGDVPEELRRAGAAGRPRCPQCAGVKPSKGKGKD